MAKTKDENGDGGKTENVDPQVLLAQILQQLVANQPAKVIDGASPEYQERLRAEGHFDSFDKPVYQNGIEAQAKGLPEQTRYRAARLAHGTYCDGKVSVSVNPSGHVFIGYNAKGDKAFAFYSKYAPSFEALIDNIWREMEAKNLVAA